MQLDDKPSPRKKRNKDPKQWTTITNIIDSLGLEKINIAIPKTYQHIYSSQKPPETLQTLNS
jgi:hypothetical protein